MRGSWGARGGPLAIVGAYCVLFAIPVRVSAGATTIGLLDVFAFGMLVLVIANWQAAAPFLARTPALVPFLAYLTVVFVGLTQAADGTTFVKEAIKLVEAFGLYMGFALLLARRDDARLHERAMAVWCVTMVGIVIIAVAWQLAFVRSVADPFIDPETTQRYFRLGWGTIAASNYFAAMLLVIVPPMLFWLTTAREALTRGQRALLLLALAMLGAALAATLSRGAFAALAVGLMIAMLLPLRGRAARVAIFAAFVGLGAVAITLSPVGWRVLTVVSGSLDQIENGRSDVWGEALRRFESRPVLGVGLGNLNLSGASDHSRTYAHNALLQVAAETGVLGLVCFATFLAALVWTNWRVMQRTRAAPDGWVFAGAFIATIVMLLHNLVENTLVGGVVFGFLFWPIQAITVARYWEELPTRALAPRLPAGATP